MTLKPEYPVVLRPLGRDDGGGWVALVPDLPGCMSDGNTAIEAFERVQEAILEWKHAAQTTGRRIPAPDDSLLSTLEQEVPGHIRAQAEAFARQMVGGRGDRIDPTVVHALIAEWARSTASHIRL